MCKAISWWYTRSNRVGKLWISENTDSHSEAATEFGINDKGLGEVCAGEFWPDPEKPSADPATWKLIWDYAGFDRRPSWMDDEGEATLRRDLERAAIKYIFTSGEHKPDSCRAFVFGDDVFVTIQKGVAFCYGKCRVEARDSSCVEARGSSRVVAWDSSRVVAWDSSRVEVWGSSCVEARGSSCVVARGSSCVEARDSSSVVARGSSCVVARGSSCVVARDSSRVVAWGSSYVEARDSSRVEARDSSSVEAWGSSRVVAWDSSRVVAWDSSRVEVWGSSCVEDESKYADICGRADWDGNGYPPVRCEIKVGKTYGVRGGKMVELVTAAKELEGCLPERSE